MKNKTKESGTLHVGTSFSAGLQMLHKSYRGDVASIYGYVRRTHDVVNQCISEKSNTRFIAWKSETLEALKKGVSEEPVLRGFVLTIRYNKIGHYLVDAFLFSMEMELKQQSFTSYEFNRYIYGSAEVIGLMCLKVFYKEDEESYKKLFYPARKLGYAFQMVNFLRDLNSDYKERGLVYFPNLDIENFTREDKRKIEFVIENAFYEAWHGIMHLNPEIRTGVYVSYLYFTRLLKRIRKASPEELLRNNNRVPLWEKVFLAVKAVFDLNSGMVKKPDTLTLQVEIDRKSGFCGGVVKAVKKAEDLLAEHGELYCVGEIVHNEEEVRRLEQKGLITIEKEQLKELKGKPVLFRAHGEPPKSYGESETGKNQLTDATCPIVLRIQDKMKLARSRGEEIFLFGKKTHPETIGLKGHVDGNAVVIESLKELKEKELPQAISLFSQTTKDPVEFKEVIEYIEKSGVTLKVYDTICRSVSNRKENLQNFSKTHDKVLFVAGENSSNGKVLYKACKEANPNTYFVHSPNNVLRKWFAKGDKVGICGATSTPKWLMEEVQNIVSSY